MEISVDVRENLLKAKKVLSSPKEFFKATTKEKDWKNAFSFMLVVSLIGHIFTALYSLLFYPSMMAGLSEAMGTEEVVYTPVQIVTAVVISFVLTLAMSFLWGGALKVWLSLFKVESTYAQAYRVMVYSRTPNYLLSWLPFVNLFAAIYSFYLMLLGIEREYEVKRKKAIAIIATSVLAVLVASALIFAFLPTL